MSVADLLGQPHNVTGSTTEGSLAPIYPCISLLLMHILPVTPNSPFLFFFFLLFPRTLRVSIFFFFPSGIFLIGLVCGSDLSLSELCLFSLCLSLHQTYIQAGPYAFLSHMPSVTHLSTLWLCVSFRARSLALERRHEYSHIASVASLSSALATHWTTRALFLADLLV
ncbi:hypothetical protein BJX76DRAFT_328404 [Aspergillus varians]